MKDDKVMGKKPEEKKDNFQYIVRIANTDIDGNKTFLMGLTRIKGIGFMMANALCSSANISRVKKVGELSKQEIEKVESVIKDPLKAGIPSWMLNRVRDPETGENMHLIGSDLNFVVDNDIKMMKKMKSYKGVRHSSGLPVRGQKTKSNFRKNKGKVTGVKRRKGAKSGRT